MSSVLGDIDRVLSFLESALAPAAEEPSPDSVTTEATAPAKESDTIAMRMFEESSPNWGLWFEMTDILVSDKSELQQMKILQTPQFGKMLVVDGKTQSTTGDEHIYHESLVHPSFMAFAMLNESKKTTPESSTFGSSTRALARPKRVFVGGAGEFATAREILRYYELSVHGTVDSDASFTLVDIDSKVLDLSKRYLFEMHRGLYADRRCQVVIDSAADFLRKRKAAIDSDASGGEQLYDLMILDICDPIEVGPAIECYTKEFYTLCKSLLKPNGVLVTQCGKGGFQNFDECAPVIHNTLECVFGEANVLLYNVEIPSFGMPWAFCLALNAECAKSAETVIRDLKSNPERIDELIAAAKLNDSRLVAPFGGPLRHYDGTSHIHMFLQLKHVRVALAKEQRVLTEDNPIFMY